MGWKQGGWEIEREKYGEKCCFLLFGWGKKIGDIKNRGESFPSWAYFFYPPKLGGKWGGKSDEKCILYKYPNFITLTYPLTFLLLYNKDIIVNLYKLHFPSFPFSLQLNKKVFHSLTFPPLQPNTHEEKSNLFYFLIFPSSHFSTLSTKRTLNANHLDSVLFFSCILLRESNYYYYYFFESKRIQLLVRVIV